MSKKFYTGIQLLGGTITGVPDPSGATDVVNLQTLQSFIRGMVIKDAVDAASTSNITLATPGASMDGVTLSNPSRVLLMGQTDPTQNGIYDWTAAASTLTRSSDADGTGGQGSELRGGVIVYVTAGTANGDKSFVISSPNGDVAIGTDSMTWTAFGGGGVTYSAGNGLQLASTTFSILLDTNSGLSVSGSGLKIDSSVVTRKFAQNIGNGSSTSIAVTHNLGTKDINPVCRDNSNDEFIECDIVATDTNTATYTFATAPASNSFRAIVMG